MAETQRAIEDVARRAVSGLEQDWHLYVLSLCLVLLFAIPQLQRFVREPLLLRRSLLALAILIGCFYAWSLLWASDDAYIAFRYARNWVEGLGLVFNPGERVEGYTDFLWVVVAAGFLRAGIHPAQGTIFVNLLSLIGICLLVSRLARRLSPGNAAPLPLAAVLCVTSYAVVSFATGALETLFASFLTVCALERAESGRPLASGTFAIAATLAHPDHALVYVALGLAFATSRKHWAQLGWYLGPLLFVFLPYVAVRASYYQDWLPNTYYAKSGGEPYYSQGLIYWAVTFIGAKAAATFPLALTAVALQHAKLGVRFAAIVIPMFFLYVVKLGGDFMLGRLWVTPLVLLFLLAEVGYRSLAVRGQSLWLGAGLAVCSVALVPSSVVEPGEIFHGIADERTFTPVTDFGSMQVRASGYATGRALRERLFDRGYSPRIAVHSLGMVSYESRLPVFDLRGLTSKSVARLPLLERGRPGHEKLAAPAHVLEDGALLSAIPVYPNHVGQEFVTRIGPSTFHYTRHDPRIARALGDEKRFRRYLRRLPRRLAHLSPDQVACEMWYLRSFFGSSLPGAARQRIEQAAARVLGPREVHPLLLEARDLERLGYRRLWKLPIEPGRPQESGWLAKGDAHPVFGAALPQQMQVLGPEGGLPLNTFTPELRDRAQMTLTSPPFVIEGDYLTLWVGGGRDAARLRVELLAGDHDVIAEVTGCDSEVLGRRAIDVSTLRGQAARIRVVDHSVEGWGHLLLDEVVQWSASDVSQ